MNLNKLFQRFIIAITVSAILLFLFFQISSNKPELLDNFSFFTVKEFIRKKMDEIPFTKDEDENVKIDALMETIKKRRELAVKQEENQPKGLPALSEEDDLLNAINDLRDEIKDLKSMNNATSPTANVSNDPILSDLPTEIITNVRTDQNSIAFTMDVESNSNNLAKSLDFLKKVDKKITFFISLEFASSYTEIIDNIIYNGNEIGLLVTKPNLSIEEINLELSQFKKRIKNDKVYLVRFSDNNSISKDMKNAVEMANFRIISSNQRVDNESQDSDETLKNLKSTSKHGDIVEFKSSDLRLLDILPEYIRFLGEKNINVTTVLNLF